MEHTTKLWKKEFVFWITLKPIIKENPWSIVFEKEGKPHNIGFPAVISKYTSGQICSISYCKNGAKYNDDRFACVKYYESGIIKDIRWTLNVDRGYPDLKECFDRNNVEHTFGIKYYKNGQVKKKIYSRKYKTIESEIFPHSVGFYKNGKLRFVNYVFDKNIPPSWKYTSIKYYKSGNIKVLSRDSADSTITKIFYEDGNLCSEYHIRGKYRNGWHTYVVYNANGIIKRKEYRGDGKRHNSKSVLPANITIRKYYDSGKKRVEKYYNINPARIMIRIGKTKYDKNGNIIYQY